MCCVPDMNFKEHRSIETRDTTKKYFGHIKCPCFLRRPLHVIVAVIGNYVPAVCVDAPGLLTNASYLIVTFFALFLPSETEPLFTKLSRHPLMGFLSSCQHHHHSYLFEATVQDGLKRRCSGQARNFDFKEGNLKCFVVCMN
jgi:hypothetical protein